jgi:hypothetical protein
MEKGVMARLGRAFWGDWAGFGVLKEDLPCLLFI